MARCKLSKINKKPSLLKASICFCQKDLQDLDGELKERTRVSVAASVKNE